MPAFCARVERFMIWLPNTPSRSAPSRSFRMTVNSLSSEPVQFGFGSPMILLSESLQVPPEIARRAASVAPMSTVWLLRR